MNPWFARLRRAIGGKKAGLPRLSYEEARELAQSEDAERRRQLARRGDVWPEILYFLAADPRPEVRREIAANPASPAQADWSLAADADAAVRGELARKIARLAPNLSADEQDRLRQMTYATLALLARDQIVMVRQILAEALKDVANAPPEVIRQLAHDSEIAVSGPILEFSPVLTDEDLLEIIRSAPVAGAVSAISRRGAVHETVADAIAGTDDVEAIALLLANPSAQIREETLDLLLDRAPRHEAWHGPMVRRPHLSARAATRLARFVAESLLKILDQRTDFDDATKQAVAAAVRRRVEERGSDMAAFRPNGRRSDVDAAAETPRQAAEGMHRSGHLSEAVIATALSANDIEFVVSALALRADVSIERVRKIVSTQSAKGMTALAWQAGLSPTMAVALQTQLSRIAPSDVLPPRPGTTNFPLEAAEMAWQLDFFASMVGDQEAVRHPVE